MGCLIQASEIGHRDAGVSHKIGEVVMLLISQMSLTLMIAFDVPC